MHLFIKGFFSVEEMHPLKKYYFKVYPFKKVNFLSLNNISDKNNMFISMYFLFFS